MKSPLGRTGESLPERQGTQAFCDPLRDVPPAPQGEPRGGLATNGRVRPQAWGNPNWVPLACGRGHQVQSGIFATEQLQPSGKGAMYLALHCLLLKQTRLVRRLNQRLRLGERLVEVGEEGFQALGELVEFLHIMFQVGVVGVFFQ